MSISAAIIVVRRHLSGIGPATPVAGTPLVARLLHALADAGMSQATLYGDLTPEEAQSILSESVEERIEVQLARTRPGETELLAMRRLAGAAPSAVLLVPGDLYCEARVFEALIRDPALGSPTIVLSPEGYTGLGVVDLASISRLGGSLEYIDDLVAMAERGEAHIATAAGMCRRLWEARDVEEVAVQLIDEALAVPGEPDVWRRVAAPLRRELLPGALRRHSAPALLAVLGTLMLLGAAVALMQEGGTALGAGVALLVGASILAGVELPLHRALRSRIAPGSLHPQVRHAVLLGIILAALTARHHALHPQSTWVTMVGGGAAWLTLVAALLAHLTWKHPRYGEALETLGPPHGSALTGALLSGRWLVRPPFPGLVLAVCWVIGARSAVLLGAAVAAGAAVFSFAFGVLQVRDLRRRPQWPEAGAREPLWAQPMEADALDAEVAEPPSGRGRRRGRAARDDEGVPRLQREGGTAARLHTTDELQVGTAELLDDSDGE